MITYKYEDMPNKTKEGLLAEMRKGFAIAAVFFQTTHGVPFEVFQSWVDGEILKTQAQQMVWYLSFRNQYPHLFK